MEERESGLSSTTNRAKGKEKGSFWNRSRQRTKPPKDLPPKPLPETEPSSPHQSEQHSSKNDEVLEEKKEEKEKEKEEDEGDPCTDADDRQPPQSKTSVAEADEDSEEETIDFPKDVGNDSGREEQAAFSALVKSFLEMDELMKDNRDGATAVVTLASMRYALFLPPALAPPLSCLVLAFPSLGYANCLWPTLVTPGLYCAGGYKSLSPLVYSMSVS